MLEKKSCVPCEGGLPVVTPDKAKEMLGELKDWSISADGKWLEKKFIFKNFVLALAHVNRVGEIAEAEGHHPDLALGWGYVHIRLQTHAIGGLHENDFILAAKIDKIQ